MRHRRSSATARSAASWPRTCAPRGHAVRPTTSSSAATRAMPLREHARAARRGARRVACRGRRSGAELVVSAVTASQAVAVGRGLRAGARRDGAFFLDFNSASPGAKIAAAGIVDARRRPLRRGRRDDLGPAVPHQGAAAARRPARRGAAAAADDSASPPRSRATSSASPAPPRCAAA